MSTHCQTVNTCLTGRVHSIETLGTVDGPGLRYIVFLQGCPLRCQYCHNPDCQDPKVGQSKTPEEVVADIVRYKHYLRSGGVTVSGGEPLLQPSFVAEIFRRCHEHGIHTALDTSGFCPIRMAEPVLAEADLVLLDIKSFRPETYKHVTGVSVEPTLTLARTLSERGIPAWIRYVLVPGLTDNLEEVAELAQFVSTLKNVERVEVLPFHKMGESKYQALGMAYKLFDTPPASKELVASVESIFLDAGCPLVKGE